MLRDRDPGQKLTSYSSFAIFECVSCYGKRGSCVKVVVVLQVFDGPVNVAEVGGSRLLRSVLMWEKLSCLNAVTEQLIPVLEGRSR